MENIIYNELKTRGYNVDVGIVDVNDMDKNGRYRKKQLEIDFVANQGSKRYYVQSAFRMDNEDKVRKEQRSLKNVPDSFKKLIVVRDAIKPKRNDLGIKEFLLNENSMDE